MNVCAAVPPQGLSVQGVNGRPAVGVASARLVWVRHMWHAASRGRGVVPTAEGCSLAWRAGNQWLSKEPCGSDTLHQLLGSVLPLRGGGGANSNASASSLALQPQIDPAVVQEPAQRRRPAGWQAGERAGQRRAAASRRASNRFHIWHDAGTSCSATAAPPQLPRRAGPGRPPPAL